MTLESSTATTPPSCAYKYYEQSHTLKFSQVLVVDGIKLITQFCNWQIIEHIGLLSSCTFKKTTGEKEGELGETNESRSK